MRVDVLKKLKVGSPVTGPGKPDVKKIRIGLAVVVGLAVDGGGTYNDNVVAVVILVSAG
jgi:hypothetical protein